MVVKYKDLSVYVTHRKRIITVSTHEQFNLTVCSAIHAEYAYLSVPKNTCHLLKQANTKRMMDRQADGQTEQ